MFAISKCRGNQIEVDVKIAVGLVCARKVRRARRSNVSKLGRYSVHRGGLHGGFTCKDYLVLDECG